MSEASRTDANIKMNTLMTGLLKCKLGAVKASPRCQNNVSKRAELQMLWQRGTFSRGGSLIRSRTHKPLSHRDSGKYTGNVFRHLFPDRQICCIHTASDSGFPSIYVCNIKLVQYYVNIFFIMTYYKLMLIFMGISRRIFIFLRAFSKKTKSANANTCRMHLENMLHVKMWRKKTLNILG